MNFAPTFTEPETLQAMEIIKMEPKNMTDPTMSELLLDYNEFDISQRVKQYQNNKLLLHPGNHSTQRNES
jgi:hypothetical protein